MTSETAKYIVVGGGIAGVTCVEQLASQNTGDDVLLLTPYPLIKAVTNFRQVSRTLEEFVVEERNVETLKRVSPRVRVIQAAVTKLDGEAHEVHTADGRRFGYGKLCICSGATPKLLAKGNPFVLGIRDTDSVQELQKRLVGSRRIVVVGNGGIALELVHEVRDCEVIWAIKDPSFGTTFFDSAAAEFFLPSLRNSSSPGASGPSRRTKYTTSPGSTAVMGKLAGGMAGSALGPDWQENLHMQGANDTRRVHIEFECEVEQICEQKPAGIAMRERDVGVQKQQAVEDSWSVYVKLSNGAVYGCDFIVSATGVRPCTQPFLEGNELIMAEDGGLLVDDHMKTSVPDVYAAGDVCSVSWTRDVHWFQMRLWTQARQMGAYAARCILADSVGEPVDLDFCFELFAHITRFFGYKVVLLGRYNGQGLGSDCELLLRCTPGVEYVKLVMQCGRVVGALFVGDTDLEETFENLILNQMDLSAYGEGLLNPCVDIEDYFD
uniref:pyridine nucleotide-disulfide oxidoreductase domain-containing protein 1 n=1 Tax=Myxine glutinosa TaxID=7769 RepID=UPI00358F0E13